MTTTYDLAGLVACSWPARPAMMLGRTDGRRLGTATSMAVRVDRCRSEAGRIDPSTTAVVVDHQHHTARPGYREVAEPACRGPRR